MINRDHDLPVPRQAQMLSISRGSVYYLLRPVSADDLVLMRRIDELHLDHSFAGARMLRDLLAGDGIIVGRLDAASPRPLAVTVATEWQASRNGSPRLPDGNIWHDSGTAGDTS